MGSTARKINHEPQKTFLVVDDNAMMLKFWERLLKTLNYPCCTASSAQEALETVEQVNIDIIIVDLVMPKMNGLQLIDKILKNHPKTKIVLTTGYFYDFEKIFTKSHHNLLHILLKPYHNIDNISIFINQMFDKNKKSKKDKKIHPTAITSNGKIQLWAL